MKKIICAIIALLMLVPSAFAEDMTKYADALNKVGTFGGTDKGYELENVLTREQAAAILTRLTGAEADADDYDEVFDDVPADRWSFGYVMYCYENEIANGTGDNCFSPDEEISAEQFTALILRTLGYDAEPETAFDTAVGAMMLSSKRAAALKNADSFTRGDMVYITYKALGTKTPDGTVFAYALADKGVLTDEQAESFDIYKTANDVDEILESFFE